MPLTRVIQAKDIDGLLPAVDRRQPEKIFVVDGRNFNWTVQGPQSGFGSRHVGSQNIDDPELGETFRLDNEIIFCGSKAFYQYDAASMTFYPLYFFGSNPEGYPWSSCKILTKFYFCRKGLGVFEFNPALNHWRHLTPVGLPTNPVAICTVRGRLIVLGTSEYAWSAIENADDFTDSLATGVARQLLSIIGGDAFSVRPTADGFIVYTSAGLASAEFNDSQAVFRHEALTRIYKPINPFCVVEIDEGRHLFVDKKGMFTTDGGKPQSFLPLFGEFLNEKLLATRDLGVNTTFRMHLARDQQMLFFMVSLPSNARLYQQSYCIDIPTQKIGTFDRLHYGFGELNLGTNSFYDFNFGFIDADGFFHRFTEEPFNEITERPDGGTIHHTDFDMPSRRMDSTYFFTSLMNMTAERDDLLVGQESGFYTFGPTFTSTSQVDGDVIVGTLAAINLFPAFGSINGEMSLIGAIQQEIVPGPLDSFIELGLIRFTELKYDDEMAEIMHLSVHSGDLDEESEDWNILGGEEDLLTSTMPDEDWGIGIAFGDQYTAILMGTNDGYTQFEQHRVQLTNQAPASERVERYPGNMVKGVFHTLRIEAMEISFTYHVKTVELTGMSAGRIA